MSQKEFEERTGLKVTDEERKIIEKLKSRLNRRLSGIESEIAEYKQKFNEDYSKFLLWYAEDLYKSEQEFAHYNSLLTAVETGDLDFIKECLRHKIEHWSDDLIHGSLRRSSTSSIANFTHVLDLEVKQKMITRCQAFLSEIVESLG